MIETKDLLRKIKLARKYIQDQEYQEAYNTLYLPPENESNLVEALVSPTEPTQETCKWALYDPTESSSTYEPDCCEHIWGFNNDGITENNFKYCPYCSKPIEEVKPHLDDDE